MDNCASAYEQGLQQHEAEAGGLLAQMSAKPLMNVSNAMRKSYLNFQTILVGLSIKEIRSKIRAARPPSLSLELRLVVQGKYQWLGDFWPPCQGGISAPSQ